MWNLGYDFPLYSVKFGGVNFLGGSIPSMSQENSVWYLGTGSLGTDLVVRATDLVGTMVLSGVIVVRLLSLACRSPSQFYLALSVLRRSMLEWARLGDTLRILDATDLLLLRLSRLTWD